MKIKGGKKTKAKVRALKKPPLKIKKKNKDGLKKQKRECDGVQLKKSPLFCIQNDGKKKIIKLKSHRFFKQII